MHAFNYDDAGRVTTVTRQLSAECAPTCCAAMEQLSAKVFKLSFECLHIYSPKVAIFAEKTANLHH